jgi:hypothetical protein
MQRIKKGFVTSNREGGLDLMTFIDSINFLFLFVIKHFKESSRIRIQV